MQTLTGQNIMIVEDDYFVANELADHFRAAKARVLGPFPTVFDASDYIGDADLAVLDLNLRDQKVYPLADRLMEAAIPFVFYSAQSIAGIPGRFSHITHLAKPCQPGEAVALLEREARSHARDLVSLLPRLRLSARLILTDPIAADRLVEATFELALQEQSALNTVPPLEKWLQQLMERALAERGRDLLN